MDYKQAGVDTQAHREALSNLKEKIRGSFGDGVAGDVGHFGGLFSLPGDSERLLVATTDGLGTKVKLLSGLGRHDRVGKDLVNHCINDIAVLGAEPLFFLDYIAGAKLERSILEPLVGGFADACREQGIALLGGETAEMPGVYEDRSYDVAGFLVGSVNRSRLIDGSEIRPGDSVIGFPSAGLHTNGYSLATKALFDVGGADAGDLVPGSNRSVGDWLSEEHTCYRREMAKLREADVVTGFAHITGGGIAENFERIMPGNCAAVIHAESWIVPPIFPFIEQKGGVARHEMFRVFNMGIGLVAVIRGGREEESLSLLDGGTVPPIPIGVIHEGSGTVEVEGM